MGMDKIRKEEDMRIKKTVFHWSILLIVILILCSKFMSKAAETVENTYMSTISMETRTGEMFEITDLISVE